MEFQSNARAVIFGRSWTRFGLHGCRLSRKTHEIRNGSRLLVKVKSWLRACGTVPRRKTSTHKTPRAVPAGTASGMSAFHSGNQWRALSPCVRRAPPPLPILPDDRLRVAFTHSHLTSPLVSQSNINCLQDTLCLA